MFKKTTPWQSNIIGYLGYIITFGLMGALLYQVIATPIILMTENNLDQDTVANISVELVATIIELGLLSVIIFKISKAIFSKRKWSIIVASIIFLWGILFGISESSGVYTIISLVLFIISASAINHPFYKKNK